MIPAPRVAGVIKSGLLRRKVKRRNCCSGSLELSRDISIFTGCVPFPCARNLKDTESVTLPVGDHRREMELGHSSKEECPMTAVYRLAQGDILRNGLWKCVPVPWLKLLWIWLRTEVRRGLGNGRRDRGFGDSIVVT